MGPLHPLSGLQTQDNLGSIMHSSLRERPVILFLLLTILWHVVLFSLPWERWFSYFKSYELAKNIQIQPLSTEQLQSIKNRWKTKKLLLAKPDDSASLSEPPKDARFISDKNKSVEKEQIAKQTQVIPKPGSESMAPTIKKQETQKSTAQPLPQLSQLGVPLFKNEPKQKVEQESIQPEEEGGDQALLEKDLPQGSENLLSSEQSVFYSFYSRLYQAVGPVWQSRIRQVPYSRRIPSGEYVTQVEVLLDRGGRLVDIRYIKSSGITDFDQAVDSAWKRIGKFPNPPSGLIESDGLVHTGWTFTVNVGSNFNVDYLPPERNY